MSKEQPPAAIVVKAGEPAKKQIETVVVHPIVLLSVTDHYNRVAKDTRKRVVGVLLGETYKGRVDITNSFAVPYEEDAKDPSIFYLDHDYLEIMMNMFKKINAKERVVGYYSTGPKIRPADIHLDALFRRYRADPVLVIIDVRPDIEGLPIQAYVTVEEVVEGKESVRSFTHLSSEVGAYEAEEIGVEHLLRDINDPSVTTLAGELRSKMAGMTGLATRLQEIAGYLGAVLEGKLPPNNEILYHVQTVISLLPNMNIDTVVKALFESTNDQHLVLYVGSLARAILALHDLVLNKTQVKDEEENEGAKEKGEKASAAEKKDDKEGKDSKEKDTKKDDKAASKH